MKPEKTSNGCQGVVFRAEVSSYRTKKDGLALTIRLNRLKRKSCPGCGFCWWLDEFLGDISPEDIQGFADVDHGRLYTFYIVKEHRDWETGMIDDLVLGVKPYREADDE